MFVLMLGKAKHPKVVVGLCVFAVVAIAAVAVSETSPGVLFLGQADPAAQVEGDYSSHLQNVHSMNVSAIERDYSSNASVQFSVPGQETTGNHTGLKSIGILFGADMFPNFALPNFSKFNSTVKVLGATAVLDSTFVISGYSSDASSQTARVRSHVEYVREGGGWVIEFESWSFNFTRTALAG
jgi:hypothetical protein